MERKKLVVRVAAGALALVTGVVMTGSLLKLNKDKSQELSLPEETVITSVTEVESSTTIPNPTTSMPEEKEFIVEYDEFTGYEDISIEEMNNNFKSNISKFDNNIKEKLTDVYTKLVKNIKSYDFYFRICGYPNCYSYINEKFVKPIGDLSFIKEIPENDPSYDELLSKYESSCYVPDENGIYVFDASFKDEEEIRLILAEEVVHSGQHVLDKFDGFGDYLILGEGEANIVAAMQKDTIISA